MLEMSPDCQRCGADLPAETPGGFICSFKCSFCTRCAGSLDDICPNCGGELIDRPTRSGALQEKYPSSTVRKHRPT